MRVTLLTYYCLSHLSFFFLCLRRSFRKSSMFGWPSADAPFRGKEELLSFRVCLLASFWYKSPSLFFPGHLLIFVYRVASLSRPVPQNMSKVPSANVMLPSSNIHIYIITCILNLYYLSSVISTH